MKNKRNTQLLAGATPRVSRTAVRASGSREPAVRKTRAVKVKRRKRNPNRPLTEMQIRELLSAIDSIRDDALIHLGLSVGLRVSEVVGIRSSELDFKRGLIKIWNAKKEKRRHVMPTLEALSAIRKYLKTLPKQPKTLFPISAKTVERLIQGYSKQALGFIISWHSLRTTYVARSVELEQSPSVVMANTGDSPATILKYYAKLPEVVMRKFVENKPVIPGGTV
jgi:integrase